MKNNTKKHNYETKIENLRIAMIGHKRIPSREGGIEIVVDELSTRLIGRGCKVVAYNRSGHHVSGSEFDECKDRKKLNSYKGVRIITVPTIERKGMAAVTSSFCASVKALFGRYDCIHYHAEGPCVMLFLPHFFHIRTIATIHGLDWQRSKWGGFASWYLKQGEKMAVKYADEIIVLSKNVQNYFEDTYQRKTVFIPNGISKPEVRNFKLIKRWELQKDSYLLFVGRIVPEKGLEYLIEAFKKVKTDKKLVIAGGKSDTDTYMEKMINLAKEDDRIILTGFVQGQVLEELYSNSYLYILPSDLEGMPISLLEAMSYGNCCMVSSIQECTEVVEDKAIVFEKGNISDLYEKLQFYCDHPNQVQEYKNEASDFICRKYSWNDIVERTLQLYKSMRNEVENDSGSSFC